MILRQGSLAGCCGERAGRRCAWQGSGDVVRTVNAKQAALRKAREKRLALDADRDARDRRIEDATADVLVLMDERVKAEAELARVSEQIGAGLRRLLDEGVRVDGAAHLASLDTAEVRRLTKPTSPARERSAEHGNNALADATTPDGRGQRAAG